MATDVLTCPAKAKRTPERSALAEAIEARDAAAARLREVMEEASEFDVKFNATRDRYFAAEEALTEERSRLVRMQQMHAGDDTAIVAHALKHGEVPPRYAVEDAEDAYLRETENYDRAKEGRHRVQGMVRAARDKHDDLKVQVDSAAEAVLRTALPKVVDQAEKARVAYMSAVSVVGRVARHLEGLILTSWNADDNSLRRRAGAVIRRDAFGGDDRENQALERATVEPWQAAHAALCNDADAALPD